MALLGCISITVRGITQRQAETVHAHSRLYDLHARCHQSKVVTDFLKENKISGLNGPGTTQISIENPWIIMNDKVANKQPASTQQLRQAIKEVWVTEISEEYCEFLVSTMSCHFQAVTDSK